MKDWQSDEEEENINIRSNDGRTVINIYLLHSTFTHSLEHKMQVSRQSRVSELRRSIVVVDKVHTASCSVSDLPAWWQGAELLTIYIA